MLDWLKDGQKYTIELLGEPAGIVWHDKLPPKKRDTPECLMCQEELVRHYLDYPNPPGHPRHKYRGSLCDNAHEHLIQNPLSRDQFAQIVRKVR